MADRVHRAALLILSDFSVLFLQTSPRMTQPYSPGGKLSTGNSSLCKRAEESTGLQVPTGPKCLLAGISNAIHANFYSGARLVSLFVPRAWMEHYAFNQLLSRIRLTVLEERGAAARLRACCEVRCINLQAVSHSRHHAYNDTP